MPGATLPNTGIVLPLAGGDPGTWDDEINAAFGNYDAHDHTSGKGARIVTSALNINADLTFAGFAATNVGKLAFTEIAALTGGTDTVYVDSATHELMWRTHGGVNVQLTSGNSINVSLVGGILGDYQTTGAQFSYVDATPEYTAKGKSAAFNWVLIHSGGLRLAPAGGTSALYTGIKCNAAIGGSYDLTLPAAQAGGNSMVQVDNTGAISFSNTHLSAPTAPDYKISAPGVTISIPPAMATQGGSDTQIQDATHGLFGFNLAANPGGPSTWPIPLKIGDKITGWKVYLNKPSDATHTISAILGARDATSNVVLEDFAKTTAAVSPGFVTLSDTGLSHVIAAGQAWGIAVQHSVGSSGGDQVFLVEVTYERP